MIRPHHYLGLKLSEQRLVLISGFSRLKAGKGFIDRIVFGHGVLAV